jgi:peptide/nickel transport system substrate-binding protein
MWLLALLCACSTTVKQEGAGRTLVFTGLAGEPDSLNPLLSAMSDVDSLSHLYMSYLLESDDRGQLIPEIADRIPTQANGGISPDGKTITYHLRHGVLWQDGVPLTARDVVFSYRAVMNPATNVPIRVGYSVVESARAVRDDTVVLHLRRPFSPLLSYFFGPQGVAAIMPEHLLGRYHDLNRVSYNQAPIGSGPFRVVQWRHGDAVTFAANPLYWRGKPRIPKVVFRLIPDPNTRLQQLQTGEADAYFDVDPQLLPQLRSLPGVHIALTPVNDLHVLRFNVRDSIVGDVRVRRAIAMAIDRRRLIAAATHGSGLIVNGDQPRNGWAYDGSLPQPAYDQAAAKKLLDTAGWTMQSNGTRAKGGRPLDLTLTISPQNINGSALVAVVIQQYLRSIGIGLTIKQVPAGSLWAPAAAGGVLASGRYQLAYDAWWILGPDPDDSWNFGCDQIPPHGENYYFWCNRQADAAVYHALATYDQAARIADYAVVQREVLTDMPELTLWQVQMPNAYRSALHGVAPSPFGSAFWNAWSWTLR